jgi:hypothetical protein
MQGTYYTHFFAACNQGSVNLATKPLLKGRLSTVDLIKVVCFVKEKNNVFIIRRT